MKDGPVAMVGVDLDAELEPDVVVVDDLHGIPANSWLVVIEDPNLNAAKVLELRSRAPGARILVRLSHDVTEDIVRGCYDSGVDDVVIGDAQLARRMIEMRHQRRLATAYAMRVEAYEGMRELVTDITTRPDLQDVLRTSIMRMSQLFNIARVSVVLFQPGDEYGFIVTRRKGHLENLVIRLDEYPELREVARTQNPLLIPDVYGDALLSGVRAKLGAAELRHKSSVLFPLFRKGEVVGALFLRSRTPMHLVEGRLLRMGRLIASITSIAIGNALETDMLMREQRALLRDKEDADQLLEALRPFSEFFEQAHDGTVVTNGEGKIQFANRAAAAILRASPDALKHKTLFDLLAPSYHRLAARALAGEEVGDVYGYVDLLVPFDEGDVVVSAGFRVLSEAGGVLVAFRDVTKLREIENELRHTKDFLENMIQSSVDAIIAADTNGQIILFNRAAEQLLGYSAREVVGSMNARDVYDEGQAQEVMRRMRSDAFGGRGRLESSRIDVLARDGERVPVNLSAAIIYEGASEIASVGIFTDLRERMSMEKKLNQVQERLRVSERQSVAMELAGAAAHELNQPLTSILGYAELLRRRLGEDAKHHKPVSVICRETERMAEIVRRLGQITDYRSRQYVGDSTILDLSETSSDAEDSREEEST